MHHEVAKNVSAGGRNFASIKPMVDQELLVRGGFGRAVKSHPECSHIAHDAGVQDIGATG